MNQDKILIIGACGQIGTALTRALADRFGNGNIITADTCDQPCENDFPAYVQLETLGYHELEEVIRNNTVTQVYLLQTVLPAAVENVQNAAWQLNVQALLSVLNIAKIQRLDKVFWPSSIAVFGPGCPKYNCPQNNKSEPDTIYGISKRTGEYWCSYFFEKYGVDVRSVRYPGLISCTVLPGGGPADYASEIFHRALENQAYSCFIAEDKCLPMMYIKDAVRATLELMEAPKENISVRTSYNIAGLSFAPCDLVAEIRKHIPAFSTRYEPDYRDAVASKWPASIRDDHAKKDWAWRPAYNLERLTKDILTELREMKDIQTGQRPVSLTN